MKQKPTVGKYLVLCRQDRKPDGSKGPYELATSTEFGSCAYAASYATGISSSREPVIVLVIEP